MTVCSSISLISGGPIHAILPVIVIVGYIPVSFLLLPTFDLYELIHSGEHYFLTSFMFSWQITKYLRQKNKIYLTYQLTYHRFHSRILLNVFDTISYSDSSGRNTSKLLFLYVILHLDTSLLNHFSISPLLDTFSPDSSSFGHTLISFDKTLRTHFLCIHLHSKRTVQIFILSWWPTQD